MKLSKKTKKIVIYLIGAFFILCLYLFFAGSSMQMNLSLKFSETEYSKVAQNFLNQNSIKNIQISSGILTTNESINNCSRYPESKTTPWSCGVGVYPDQSSISFETVDEVLAYQKISKEDYLYYVNFLKDKNFTGIGKDGNKKFVEIVKGLSGLRYYDNSNIGEFTTDSNYTYVKKINDHWFSFVTDWN